MVSDHEQQRARYLANAEGAPPVPPPGGYRGARRQQPFPVPLPPASAPATDPSVPERGPSGPLGWIALVAAILFGLILLGTLVVGGTDLLYGVTMIALQLVVLAVVIAALAVRGSRRLGAIALIVVLLCNVATVGAVSALRTSASGSYEGAKTDEQRHAEAYPGIKGTDPQQALGQQSLDEVRVQADALFADIRERLTAEFGYTWVPVGEEDLRPERNGYGGESMLIEYTSVAWATTEPIQDYDRKRAVMSVINDVVLDHGLWDLYAFNDPAVSGMDPAVIAKLYGSDDPRTQDSWEYYTENHPDPLRFYATINDLSHDEDGGFRTARKAQSARTGEPLEGLQLMVVASGVLSEADRAEFEERLREYPGFE
ncbi:MAG: hypothetical protein DI566_14070 [Microbacterium sp.]|nr:MAG: hypothetical protein DI566_14070 [Microbacterium sp.]